MPRTWIQLDVDQELLEAIMQQTGKTHTEALCLIRDLHDDFLEKHTRDYGYGVLRSSPDAIHLVPLDEIGDDEEYSYYQLR